MLRFPRQAPHCNTDQVHNLSVSQDTEKKMYPFWGKKKPESGWGAKLPHGTPFARSMVMGRAFFSLCGVNSASPTSTQPAMLEKHLLPLLTFSFPKEMIKKLKKHFHMEDSNPNRSPQDTSNTIKQEELKKAEKFIEPHNLSCKKKKKKKKSPG